MNYQIMTQVQGQGHLCVAQVPADVPNAYSIAEDIARTVSHRGHSYIFTSGRVAGQFTNGRRDPTLNCACGETPAFTDAFGKTLCPDCAADRSADGAAIWRLDGTLVDAR